MLSSAHSYSSYYFSSYFKVHLFITHLHLHHFYNTNQTTNCNYKSYFKHLSVLLAFVSFTYQSIFQSITELHSFHFREALWVLYIKCDIANYKLSLLTFIGCWQHHHWNIQLHPQEKHHLCLSTTRTNRSWLSRGGWNPRSKVPRCCGEGAIIWHRACPNTQSTESSQSCKSMILWRLILYYNIWNKSGLKKGISLHVLILSRVEIIFRLFTNFSSNSISNWKRFIQINSWK